MPILLIYDTCGADTLKFYYIPGEYAALAMACDDKFINSDDQTPEMDKLNDLLKTLTPLERTSINPTIFSRITTFGFVP